MSKAALDEYQDARDQQTTQNDARNIRSGVEGAQTTNKPVAAVRWPFELMQNAHDAGPRDEDSHVDIHLILSEGQLIVRHTGKPFTPQELAALLSGGSSKEFDDNETTGRFGTGFLVTHSLSPHVNVDGVLQTQTGYEHFIIELDRGGDEASIIENIKLSNRALQDAEDVCPSWIAENSTVSFTYRDVDCDVAQRGLRRLEQALPYLYGTCEKLGCVTIERPCGTITFNRGETSTRQLETFMFRETRIIHTDSGNSRALSVIRVGDKENESAILIITEGCAQDASLVIPNSDFPKLFVQFPITDTDFLPFCFVLDGRFAPTKERDSISMGESYKDLIHGAMLALPDLVRHSVESGWNDAHRLAQLSVPDRTISGENGETAWWKDLVKEVATATASEAIIETNGGRLPALGNGESDTASFLVASINADQKPVLDYESVHKVAATVSGLHIPSLSVAHEWGEIAKDWEETGVPVKRMGFIELSNYIKNQSSCLDNLPLSQDPITWLATLFNLASELSADWSVDQHLSGLVPNQRSELCRTGTLNLDESISEEVKDIADSINFDLRSRLLHQSMSEELEKPEFEPARSLMHGLIRDSLTECEALDAILNRLDNLLPDSKVFDEDEDKTRLQAASRLAKILCERKDMDRLRQCPLLDARGRFTRQSTGRILAPIAHWPESAQPYSELYPENRRLSDRYCEDVGLKCTLGKLIDVGLVIEAPLHRAVRGQVNDVNLLNAMHPDGEGMEGVTVDNTEFGQIAFLPGEVAQRCGQDPELAKLLLGFVINIAAREDSSWREYQSVSATQSRERIEVKVGSAVWPFELKVRPWIPVQGEKGVVPMAASESNLRELLDPTWLTDNPDGVAFLREIFGFSGLFLELERLEPDDKADAERKLLALMQEPQAMDAAIQNPEAVKIIADVEPSEVQQIVEEVKEKRRQATIREASRNFGLAAQKAIADAISCYGLVPKLIDHGFDYEVFKGTLEDALVDSTYSFKLGSYLLEVKATTTGDVRLTPLQAKTASENPHRFVLCVIDLRGQELKQCWSPSDVGPYAKFVTYIGDDVVEVYEGVDELVNLEHPVRLRNEQQLRYGIVPDLWTSGYSIDGWVQTLRTS